MSWYCAVSIPQAVSTVATTPLTVEKRTVKTRFNTASGKHCCNVAVKSLLKGGLVSIPQAVSTVATLVANMDGNLNILVSIPQAVSTVATR